MALEEVYLYSVAPKRPIRLTDGTCIRVPKSVYLSKEDLISILPKAIVYRRFVSVGINEKVTTSNIDRVHRAEYIPENEWTGETVSSENAGKVFTPSMEDNKKEETTEVVTPIEEPVVAPEVTETPVEEAVVEEVVTEENTAESVSADIADEAAIEEVNDASNDASDNVADNSTEEAQNNNYEHKSNKHKNNSYKK